MVWQRLMRQLRQKTRDTSRRNRRRLLMEQLDRRVVLASDLGAIVGVAFVDQAGDGSSAGDPPVLIDGGGNLVAPGTPGATGVQVQLFEDTNADLAFDGGDLLVGTDTTDLNGNYRFDGLVAGRYFLQQQAVPELTTPTTVTVDVTDVGGVQTALIDDYSTTTQSVTADVGTPVNTSAVAATEAIGAERDVTVTLTNAMGQLTSLADSVSDTLSIGSMGDAEGTVLIQYDGVDSSVALDATGLAGVSLAGGTPASTLDPGAGLVVQTRGDSGGDSLTITIYTDAANASSTVIPIPPDVAFQEVFVLFSDFAIDLGTGADFNDVGAIEASVGLSANNDVFVSIVEALQPELTQVDIPNILPVTLGGQVFQDDDTAGGQNNGVLDAAEPGVVGVDVELYQLSGAGDVVDPATDTLITSTTTGAGGVYSFPGLDPGHYAVVVPSSEFASGAPLFGYATSTGNDPAPDPDDDVDDDDNGTLLGNGDVASGTITLVSNSEPINDDDADANTNTTVDFGFIPQIDLSVSKTLNVAGSSVIADGNVVFDITVANAGPLDATTVQFEDVIPAGLVFTGIANASGAFTPNVNGSTVTVDIGTIASGANATFQLLADIDPNQTADITNTATVTGTEVDTDLANNSDDALLDLVESDLRIEKTDVSDPVNAGNELTYTITVTNDGPDDAIGVIVVDPIPAGVSFVSGDVDGNATLVNFDSGTGEVTATIGSVANAAISVVTITVLTDDDAASPLNNSATVTATPNTDPDASNNSASADTTVDRLVDLEIAKTFTDTPIAGQDLTFTILVTNNGPSEARNVEVADTLPAELSLVVASFDPGTSTTTISQNGQDLTFDVGTLGSGESAEFTFDVDIASSAFGNVLNTATASTTDPESDTSNDSDTATLDVERRVDLILSKSVNVNSAVPGQDQLVFDFTISHDTDSVSDAGTVVVTDMLPAELLGAVISAPTADDTDFTNNTVTVSFDSIPVGEMRTFSVTVDIDQAATGTVTNDGEVTSVGTELDATNNTDAAPAVTLTPDFDVTVDKTVDVAAPGPNDTVTYTVDLTNSGPSTAPGVILSDVIPAGLTFVSGTIAGQDASSDGTTVTFPAVDLDSGVTESATIVFTVDASSVGQITNTASVQDLTAAGENDATNNSESEDIDVIPEADLSIDKTVSLDDAQAGDQLVYTVTVSNDGPSTATNVVVADTLPAGVTFVEGTGPNSESLSETGGVVNVSGGDLADGDSFMFTITVTVDEGTSGTQTNSATVSSDVNDPDSANDSDTAVTEVDPKTSSISGTVYLDLDNDGVLDAGESGLQGIVITLTGTDALGSTVELTTATAADGTYLFENLAEGTYNVAETQPVGVRDGIETVGSGATATASDNLFSQLVLGAATDATGFNFAELNDVLSKRLFLASPPAVFQFIATT